VRCERRSGATRSRCVPGCKHAPAWRVKQPSDSLHLHFVPLKHTQASRTRKETAAAGHADAAMVARLEVRLSLVTHGSRECAQAKLDVCLHATRCR
jgi:hypothetical protein